METFTISPDDQGGFAVEVLHASGHSSFHEFKTESSAQSWIVDQKNVRKALFEEPTFREDK